MSTICDNISRGEDGVLRFAGQDTQVLAKRYGTPLYLVDEDRLRHNCKQSILPCVQKIFRRQCKGALREQGKLL